VCGGAKIPHPPAGTLSRSRERGRSGKAVPTGLPLSRERERVARKGRVRAGRVRGSPERGAPLGFAQRKDDAERGI